MATRPEQAVGSPPVLAHTGHRNEWLMHLQGSILSILRSTRMLLFSWTLPIDGSQTPPFLLVKTLDGQGLVVLFRRVCIGLHTLQT